MNFKTPDGGWSPYLAGALVGVLAIVSVIATTNIMGKTNFLGASTTFVRAAGFLESSVAASHVDENEYFKKEKVKVDWQFMLVVGILLGAFIAAKSDKSFRLEAVPPTWSERFGASVPLRAFWAFAGGVVAMIGARLADGCPSGHGLSGLMQLSLSGFAALAFFFGTGVLVANIVYRSGSAKLTTRRTS
jgi:uncharacterized protein